MKQSAIPLYCFTPNLSIYYFYNLVLTLSKGNDPTPITIADNIAVDVFGVANIVPNVRDFKLIGWLVPNYTDTLSLAYLSFDISP